MQRRTEEFQQAVQEYFDTEWTTMKGYLRRQISKCVNECKSQATNAKRIVGTIRQRKSRKRPAVTSVNNEEEEYDSEDEFDYWDSDFDEDFDEEENPECSASPDNNGNYEQQQSEEISNSAEQVNDCITSSPVNSIPKPPDAPLVTTTVTSNNQRSVIPRNSLPRPPLKRPPSQPPPPPLPLTPSPSVEGPHEGYEIPISHNLTMARSEASLSTTSSLSETTPSTPEMYEVIEPVEENYEIVETPPLPAKTEKPFLPPRQGALPNKPPPAPPLPQKPKKFQEVVRNDEVAFRSLNRPKLPIKNEDDNWNESTINPAISSAILNSFLGRRHSETSSRLEQCSSNGSNSALNQSISCSQIPQPPDLFTVGNSTFLNGITTPVPREASLRNFSQMSLENESIVSSIATRPLPPVPQPPKEIDEKPEEKDITCYPWFHEVERHNAEQTILSFDTDGIFLVRPSKRAGKDNPYTLTILHDGKVFHLNIRLRPDGAFALGKGKEKEKSFVNVASLIQYHQNEPILLTSRGESAGLTILNGYPEK